MSEVKIKKVEGCKVAAIEEQGSFDKIGSIFGELYGWISKKSIEPSGPPFGIYYDDPGKVAPEKCRYEICAPIKGDVDGDERVKIKEIPEMEVACITHKGSYSQVGSAWQKISEWIEKEGYQFAEAGREVYLNAPETTPEKELLTEIQIPISKK